MPWFYRSWSRIWWTQMCLCGLWCYHWTTSADINGQSQPPTVQDWLLFLHQKGEQIWAMLIIESMIVVWQQIMTQNSARLPHLCSIIHCDFYGTSCVLFVLAMSTRWCWLQRLHEICCKKSSFPACAFWVLRLTDKGGNGGVVLCLWDPGQHLCAEHCAYIFHLCRAGWRVAALLASTKSSWPSCTLHIPLTTRLLEKLLFEEKGSGVHFTSIQHTVGFFRLASCSGLAVLTTRLTHLSLVFTAIHGCSVYGSCCLRWTTATTMLRVQPRSLVCIILVMLTNLDGCLIG